VRKTRVHISVINDLTGDQRIHRIATTLSEAGFEVTVLGRQLPDSLPLSPRAYSTHRMRLRFRRGKLFYLFFNLRLFAYLLFRPLDILNANDLDTLLAIFLVAKLRGKRLIYDSHEYFTEVPELMDRPKTRAIWLRLEKWLFPRLQQAYTVNQDLAKIYAQKYGVKVQAIRNLPFRKPLSQPANQEPVLLYQGALNLGRGIELMMAAMEYLPDHVLWIVGKGDRGEALRKLWTACPWRDRIRFWGFVPMEKLPEITQKAKLGLSLEEDLGANYRYATPNKVFDYIQAGVPVLVSDLPAVRALVEKYGLGGILSGTQRTPKDLARHIQLIVEDAKRYESLQRACLKAAKTLCWEREREKLLQIYQKRV
jgi:glycosyltransferase involved in cell wall biosynthesis